MSSAVRMAKNGRIGNVSPWNKFVSVQSKKQENRYKSGANKGRVNLKKISALWKKSPQNKNRKSSSSSRPRTSTKKGQLRKTSRRAFMPKNGKKSKSKKVKNVQLVSSAMAITLPFLIADSSSFNQKGTNASGEFRHGRWTEGLNETIANLKLPEVQNKVFKFALGGVLLKGVAKRLGMTGWRVGNVKFTPQ